MPYLPNLGGAESNQFPQQFGHSPASETSLACTLIKQLSNDGSGTVLSHGSGCFWRHDGSIYLVTARHVLTGRSPFNDEILSKNGFIPRRITVYPTRVENNQWFRQEVTLEVNPEQPNWLQDPEFGHLKTDIAALHLGSDSVSEFRCLNDQTDIFDEIFTLVGMECSVVGYPTPNFSGLMTPIWRRGAIASEPRLPLDDKPMFLLDAATSPGFSGSPVFRQHFGPLPVQEQDGNLGMALDNVRKLSLVGIYAGRFSHAHVGGEVPFVFYANRIPMLFSGI